MYLISVLGEGKYDGEPKQRIGQITEERMCEERIGEKSYKERCETDWEFVKSQKTIRACALYMNAHANNLLAEQYSWAERLVAYYCRHPSKRGRELDELIKELKNWEVPAPLENKCLYRSRSVQQNLYGDWGRFRIKTKGSGYYLLRFYDLNRKLVALDYFMPGETEEEIMLPPGTYELKYSSGSKWYGATIGFGLGASYQKADSKFSLTSDTIWEIALYPVHNGNLKTETIDTDDFDIGME